MSQAKLGDKIRYFRERAGLSQFKLEQSIDASTGSLSRIENGEVNPMKETLIKLISLLKLNNDESVYILSPEKLFVSTSEVEQVIKKVKVSMDRLTKFSYLLDNLRVVRYFSLGFRNIMRVYGIRPEKLIGHSILEIIFDETLGVKKFFQDNKFIGMARDSLCSFLAQNRYLVDNDEIEYFCRLLEKDSEFRKMYENLLLNISEWNTSYDRTVAFKVAWKKFLFRFDVVPVNWDSRFEIIEYNYVRTNNL